MERLLLRKEFRFSLTGKITFALFSVSLFIILTLGITYLLTNIRVLNEKRIDMLEKNLQTAAASIDEVYQTANQISLQVLANTNVLKALSQPEYVYSANMELYNNASEAIGNATKFYPAVRIIRLYAKNGYAYQFVHTAGNVRQLGIENALEIYRKNGLLADEDAYFQTWGVINDRVLLSGMPPKYIFINLRSLFHPGSFANLGYLEICFYDDYIKNIYSALGGDCFIAGTDGTVILSNSEADIGANIGETKLFTELTGIGQKQASFILREGRERRIVSFAYIPTIESYIVFSEDYNQFFSEDEIIKDNILILIAGCIVICVIFARFIALRLTQSLVNLQNTMLEVRGGNLTAHYSGGQEKETQVLGDIFNSMINQLKDNIEEIRRQDEQKRLAELKLLQAQINPHLLYNTLDSVIWRLEKKDTNMAIRLITVLSGFFRASLSKGAEIVSIRQEIEQIRGYLELQMLSRGKDYSLKVYGDLSLLDCPISKTTLQPIVENMVLHGFAGYGNDGIITIRLMRTSETGFMELVLEDNGIGIPEDTLQELTKRIHAPEMDVESGGFGLWNVRQRIIRHFGAGCELSLESEYGAYTRVIIKITCPGNPTNEGEKDA